MGHSGDSCPRATATETDAQGRFRFGPWTISNLKARHASVHILAYRAGYSSDDPVFIEGQFEKWLGVFNSKTLSIDSQDLRLALKPFKGSESDRLKELRTLHATGTCRGKEDRILDYEMWEERMLEEIRQIPEANQKQEGQARSYVEGLERQMAKQRR